MGNLRTEYIDIKKVKHNVEHFTLSADNKNSRERIAEELFAVLTRRGRRTPA